MEETTHLHHRLHAPNNYFGGFLMPLWTQAGFSGRTHKIARFFPPPVYSQNLKDEERFDDQVGFAHGTLCTE
jgi:hypothetical protein